MLFEGGKAKESQLILVGVGVEDGFLLPAEGDEGLADDLLYVGGDGTEGAVELVVALTREEADEVILNGTFQVARHVVVHAFETNGHADGLVGTILRTVVLLHLGIPQIDISNNRIIVWYIRAQDVAQAMLSDGTNLTIADGVAFRHFLK